MGNMTKRIFLKARECQSLGWIMRSGDFAIIAAEPPLNQKFLMEQGIEIQKRARCLYPEGLLIDSKDMASAAEKTKQVMHDPDTSVIFEGTFFSGGLTARADILKREEDGWHLIEVKSSTNDKKEFIDDMAYTYLVMNQCGYRISRVSLLLLNKEFRLGMPGGTLFVEIDHTRDVLEKVKEFESLWQSLEEITRGPSMPKPSLRYECKKCEVFRDCVGEGIDNHIFDLPRLSTSKFQELLTRGIVCIEDIPPEISLTEPQERVRECVQGRFTSIESGLKEVLKLIQWPVFYLDFETFMTAIPLYQDTAPFAQIPFQYSIHACSERFGCVIHCEYLADSTRDCRRELAERLVGDLSGEGSIVVYTSFEERIIRSLADMFPDLKQELTSLADRIIDLEKVIRSHVYHPEFHGRTSIKVVLPVLVPGMSYDQLEIREGDTAMATFAYMALGKYSPQEIEEIRKNLLKYCKHDTLAMVALHKELLKVL
jgi:CRISPR/Cas system-associated exonuclease Cas4 (RecB family)